MMMIEFARGDSYEKGFVLKNKSTHEPITETWDEVYFTVKKNHNDTEFQFQKRMTDGGIVNDGNGHYTLFIRPEDTNDMAFGDYECDIELKKEHYKRTFYGHLKLTKEVTHAINE